MCAWMSVCVFLCVCECVCVCVCVCVWERDLKLLMSDCVEHKSRQYWISPHEISMWYNWLLLHKNLISQRLKKFLLLLYKKTDFCSRSVCVCVCVCVYVPHSRRDALSIPTSWITGNCHHFAAKPKSVTGLFLFSVIGLSHLVILRKSVFHIKCHERSCNKQLWEKNKVPFSNQMTVTCYRVWL